MNVFLESNDSDHCGVTTTAGEKEGKIFIGRLNLERLGIKDQFTRFCGGLKTLYIVKHTKASSDMKDQEEADSVI